MPFALLAHSPLDYQSMYDSVDMVIEGHLSGEIVEKVKIIRESKHPDAEFHEDVYIITYLHVDGRAKFKNQRLWPNDELRIDGEIVPRYRIVVPERLFESSLSAELENTSAWFLMNSALLDAPYAVSFLSVDKGELHIEDYMKDSI